ncbi:hypothetical protein [Nesterenkonia sp.]|uniref:hypothetical protein n=1 Tax=Nesterenkonia sp. TaxID=704201 RepID=UPI002606636D|nr:hypothetical protein [Nesterenkonia sp.]
MTDYTYTDADWRENAKYGLVGVTADDATEHWDRWLAEHDAKVRAEALREGYQSARADLLSGAFIGGPTYEALRDSFTGQKIAAEEREKAAQIAENLYFGGGSTGSANRWGAKQAAARIRKQGKEQGS